MTITQAQWSNAEESAVNAVYADGRNCWGITRERRSWADVEAFTDAGGVIEPHRDPVTTTDARLAALDARLDRLDRFEIRPLAAIASGNGTADDTRALSALEAEKAALRAERATLSREERG